MGDRILRRLLRFPPAEQPKVSSVSKMEKMVFKILQAVLPRKMLRKNI